jgi:CYTH domain-containing protein
VQAYLVAEPGKTIRVRIANQKATLTIKGKSNNGVRSEYEYEIPKPDAEALIQEFAVAQLEKYRYTFTENNKVWEVDEFLGANAGLITAEVELNSEHEHVELPNWIEKEVTSDFRYSNDQLAMHPFSTWNTPS